MCIDSKWFCAVIDNVKDTVRKYSYSYILFFYYIY